MGVMLARVSVGSIQTLGFSHRRVKPVLAQSGSTSAIGFGGSIDQYLVLITEASRI